MSDTGKLINALWNSIQRERNGHAGAAAVAFDSQDFTDTLPLDLQIFKARAVEFVAALPDEAFAEDELDMFAMGPLTVDEMHVLLMAYEEERERRDIPDPNDLEEDLEWHEEDWSDFPED